MKRHTLVAAWMFVAACLTLFGKTLGSAGHGKSQQLAGDPASASRRVVVHAAGRGNPYINFEDGVELPGSYEGAAEMQSLLKQNAAEPRALASADFDEDGVPDLICGYARTGGGIVTLHRGNVDSIYQNSPEAQRRKAEGTFTDSAFLSPARVFEAPIAADFVGAGDFDADGHWDVVIGARGRKELCLLPGDGKGGFLSARTISLPGAVTSLITGEINRADGLTDVVAGVVTDDGAKALVFEGPEGALKASAEIFSLPGEPRALALGQFDDDYAMDLAVGAGSEIVIIHGRDRTLSLDDFRQGEVLLARIDSRAFGFEIRSIAAGDFTGANATSLALLAPDGTVHLTSTKTQKAQKPGKGAKANDSQVLGRWGGATKLVSSRVSTGPADDLLSLNEDGRELQILKTGLSSDPASSLSSTIRLATSLRLDGEPLSVLPMRLNADALNDLVVLHAGRSAPAIAKTVAGTTLTVNKADDHDDGVCESADCTMREAINAANGNAGADAITFNIPGTGVHTIRPTTALPAILDPVTIDATTQSDFAGKPLVELSGSLVIGTHGLQVSAGSTLIRSFTINSFTGVEVAIYSNGNMIEGNFVGTDAEGIGGAGVLSGGVSVFPGFQNNLIGGTTSAARNVISGMAYGINLFANSTGNQIQGNYIGTDFSGALRVSNYSDGVAIFVANNNTVGGTIAGAGNVISGNGNAGILLNGSGAVVQGNLLGTDVTGRVPVGNTFGGVQIQSSSNMIGGTSSGAGNVIAHNGIAGVDVVFTSGNAILSNSIFSNDGLGINLRPNDRVSWNDPCDVDDGPNHGQNFPVLTAATSNGMSTTIQGTLDSTANTAFRIEFFANTACDASGFGEGQTFIGSTMVVTATNCGASFNINVPVAVSVGQFITATATDPAGNTSEFSQCVQVQQGPTFDLCVQDESNGNILVVNSTTGDYQFTNCRGLVLVGVGSLLKRGCLVTLQANGPDRRILARIETCLKSGTASVQVLSQGTTLTILDRNTANNTCACTGSS